MNLTKFVGSLYASAITSEDSNKVLGPGSIYTALLLVLAGAEDVTRNQLLNAMGISQDANNEDIHSKAFNLYLKDFNNKVADGPELTSCNRIYVKENFPIHKTYKDHLETKYNVVAKNVDFATNSDEIACEANSLVDETTNGKIKNIVKPQDFDANTVMLLINAIYFKGNWEKCFDGELTELQDFHKLDSSVVQVHFMTDPKNRKIGFMEFDGYRVAYLPFKNSKMRMAFILPELKNGLPNLVAKLFREDSNFAEFQDILNHSTDPTTQEVKVIIPRFEIGSTVRLNEPLQKMGVTNAFSMNDADFTRLHAENQRGIYVAKAVHKAFLKVDETGAEAAAATGIVMQSRCLRIPIEFVADHPFLVVIINEQNAPLFIGQICDPTKNEE
ncbi:hypothetical protein Ciccas_002598 [Cichlidogyrus casuarinus]|uniref:Serpin domain-containing protein n=1 Tax=Cichlidogyrus casuarinus TaxID=1844966 RepID=A0ABD2QK03_9PLAT